MNAGEFKSVIEKEKMKGDLTEMCQYLDGKKILDMKRLFNLEEKSIIRASKAHIFNSKMN